MGNGYAVPAADSLDHLRQIIMDARARLRELEALDGSQIYNTVQDLRNLIDGLLDATDISVTGNVTAGGTVTGTSGLTSPGGYALDVTTLPGARTTAWWHNSGRLGQTSSSIAKKIDLTTLPFTAADIRAVQPYMFRYIAQVEIRNDPNNPNYDPTYPVPWEVGFMAEHFLANNLDLFVWFNEDGTPGGIHYAEFGAVAAVVLAMDHEKRLERLEARA